MKSKKIPGFYFYPSDWLSSPDIRSMTDQQYRVFHVLLCTAWLSTPTATLPNTDEELARLAGVSLETWKEIKAPVMAKFEHDGNGRIFNVKLTKVHKEAKQKYEASAKRWAKKQHE